MDIFLTFASEQKDDAELIAVALRDRGHSVFFSRDTLPAASTFDLQIEKAIAAADLVIFLLSPQSVAPGKYTLTELSFVRQKWKNPSGHVLPVMVVKTPIETVPSYLRAVGILEPEGNVAAETASQADKLLVRRGGRRLAYFAVAGLASGAMSSATFSNNWSIADVPVPPGIIFGILVASCNWVFGLREKIPLMALIVFTMIAWVLAYQSTVTTYAQLDKYSKEVPANTAASPDSESQGLSESPQESLESRIAHETFPFSLALAGFVGGLVGSVVMVFGITVSNRQFRRLQDSILVVVAATLLGGLVQIPTWSFLLLFVVWQTTIIVLISNALASRPPAAT